MRIIKLKHRPTQEELSAFTENAYAIEDDQIVLVRSQNPTTRDMFFAFIRSDVATEYTCGLQIDLVLRDNLRRCGFTRISFCPVVEAFEHAKTYQKKSGNWNKVINGLNAKAVRCYELEDPAKNYEIGVELELEQRSRNKPSHMDMTHPLIHDVGGDGSLRRGCEVRFNHPRLTGWKLKDIKEILKKYADAGFGDYWGTAGMHVHVSGKNARKIAERAEEHWDEICTILYPISGRTMKVKKPGYTRPVEGYYGRRANIVKNQFGCFGTLEFRAFSTTTDPNVFYWRLIVCQALFKHLGKNKPIMDFMRCMNKKAKSAYKSLLTHKDNPHELGLPVDVVMAWIGE